MIIMFAHRKQYYKDELVQTYSVSLVRALKEMGHEVIEIQKTPFENKNDYRKADILLDMDCGRDEKGQLRWHGEDYPLRRHLPTGVIFIDSHGHPGAHRRVAKQYTHTFFAVWDKRDLFQELKSAHWCPNFTDLTWFDGTKYNPYREASYDFGFFGSRHGLQRADKLKEICEKNNYSYSIRQVTKQNKHRWPATSHAMAECRFLFNHGQKHDGPNLRVIESMAMDRPLLTDVDHRSGMDQLFTPGIHYIPYETLTYDELEENMIWAMENEEEALEIAENAYDEVCKSHTVETRAKQIMEVFNNG